MSKAKQGGGTFLGLILGMMLGLGIALGVAYYVSRLPNPFVAKNPSRLAGREAIDHNKDPNAALRSKAAPPPVQTASAGPKKKPRAPPRSNTLRPRPSASRPTRWAIWLPRAAARMTRAPATLLDCSPTLCRWGRFACTRTLRRSARACRSSVCKRRSASVSNLGAPSGVCVWGRSRTRTPPSASRRAWQATTLKRRWCVCKSSFSPSQRDALPANTAGIVLLFFIRPVQMWQTWSAGWQPALRAGTLLRRSDSDSLFFAFLSRRNPYETT